MTWRKVAGRGWCAFSDGHRLTVTRYRRGDGNGFGYVARLDGSARTSPAVARTTMALAAEEAEEMLRDVLARGRS